MIFGRGYFDRVFAKKEGWGYATSQYERAKYERQLEAMRRFCPRPQRILEIGCAEGLHSIMIAEAFPGAEVWCVDISHVAIESARQACREHGGIRLIEGNIIDLLRAGALPAKSFDILVQSEVLYYYFSWLVLHRRLSRYVTDQVDVLKDDGILVMANGLNLFTTHVTDLYCARIKKLCHEVHAADYREWNEFRGRRLAYCVRVFRRAGAG